MNDKITEKVRTLTRVWKECGRKGVPKVVDTIRGLEPEGP